MAKNSERDNVASESQNDNLEHSVEGVTTRADALDLGVPMLPGEPDEPIGPEDALSDGPTRGDYSGRLGDANYRPHAVVLNPDAGDGEPRVRVVNQRDNVKQGRPNKA